MTQPVSASSIQKFASFTSKISSTNLSGSQVDVNVRDLVNISSLSSSSLKNAYSNAMETVRDRFGLSDSQQLGGAFRTSVIAAQSTKDSHQYVISIGAGTLYTPLSHNQDGTLTRDYAATLTYVDSLRSQIRATDPLARVDLGRELINRIPLVAEF